MVGVEREYGDAIIGLVVVVVVGGSLTQLLLQLARRSVLSTN